MTKYYKFYNIGERLYRLCEQTGEAWYADWATWVEIK